MPYITQEQANKTKRILKKAILQMADIYFEMQEAEKEVQSALAKIETHKPTNGDHFRSMPDEEIAAMLQNDGCATCPIGGLCGDCELAGMTYNSEEEFDDACRAAIFRWLKMEVEEND